MFERFMGRTSFRWFSSITHNKNHPGLSVQWCFDNTEWIEAIYTKSPIFETCHIGQKERSSTSGKVRGIFIYRFAESEICLK